MPAPGDSANASQLALFGIRISERDDQKREELKGLVIFSKPSMSMFPIEDHIVNVSPPPLHCRAEATNSVAAPPASWCLFRR